MASSLSEFIGEGSHCDSDKEALLVSKEGDFLSVYFSHEDAYSERIDDLLTVFYSESSGELTGFKIKGIHRQLEKLGSLGVRCDCHPISLSLLLGSNISEVEVGTWHHYKSISVRSSKITFRPSEFATT